MSNVQEIEEAIVKLPPQDFQQLRAWIVEFDEQELDRRLEDAIKAGRFDAMAEQALKDVKAGKCKEL